MEFSNRLLNVLKINHNSRPFKNILNVWVKFAKIISIQINLE